MSEMTDGGWRRVTRTLSPAVDDPWWEHPVFGCEAQEHVSTMLLKSEQLGKSVCLVDQSDVFPIEL